MIDIGIEYVRRTECTDTKMAVIFKIETSMQLGAVGCDNIPVKVTNPMDNTKYCLQMICL